MTTPSPAPQQWQIELADALFDCWKNKLGGWASHLPTREEMLTLVTKHAAAISEENERLKRIVKDFEEEHEAVGIVMANAQNDLTALRQWSDQAREAMNLMVRTFESYALPGVRLQAVNTCRNLLAAHPAQGMEGRG